MVVPLNLLKDVRMRSLEDIEMTITDQDVDMSEEPPTPKLVERDYLKPMFMRINCLIPPKTPIPTPFVQIICDRHAGKWGQKILVAPIKLGDKFTDDIQVVYKDKNNRLRHSLEKPKAILYPWRADLRS
jgi:hypothetical protein